MSFHLVTTSDPELRSIDKENLFLGSWCVLFKEKISKKGKNFTYVRPKPIDKETLDKDQKKIIDYSQKLFKDVFEILNKQHNEKFNDRQWTIMLGILIHKYVSLIINRYDNLERAIKNHDISSSTFFYSKDYELSSKNTLNFLEICDENLWNNTLYYKLLNYIDHNFEKKILSIEKKKIETEKKSIKYFIKKISNYIFKHKIINSDSFITNTYLRKIDELKLLFLFKQPPIFLEDNINYNPTDILLRSKLKTLLLKNKNKDLESAIRGIFFDIFPNVYLESFSNLKNKLKLLYLPKNPKFMFTSNDFETSETFKLYCANKIENSKYIVGQHGSTYGSGRYQASQIYILKTADKFITWGWNKNEKTKRGFLFSKLTPVIKKGKKITYMIGLIMHKWRTYDLHYELENEFTDDFNLVKKINKNIRENLQIKMHPGDGKFFDFQTKLRWLNQFPDIEIIQSKTNFDKFKNNSKLFIFNFTGTGFLQLININFPSLLVLRNFDFQIDDQYKKYFEYLIDAKILHLSNDSLIKHLNEISNDIDAWWNSFNTQKNLQKFVKIFANNDNSSPKNLKKILLEV